MFSGSLDGVGAARNDAVAGFGPRFLFGEKCCCRVEKAGRLGSASAGDNGGFSIVASFRSPVPLRVTPFSFGGAAALDVLERACLVPACCCTCVAGSFDGCGANNRDRGLVGFNVLDCGGTWDAEPSYIDIGLVGFNVRGRGAGGGALPVFCDEMDDAVLRCPGAAGMEEDAAVEPDRLCFEVGTARCREGKEFVVGEAVVVCLDLLVADCRCRNLFAASKAALRVTDGLDCSARPVCLLLIREVGGSIEPSFEVLSAMRTSDEEEKEDDELRVTGNLLGDCVSLISAFRWLVVASLGAGELVDGCGKEVALLTIERGGVGAISDDEEDMIL